MRRYKHCEAYARFDITLQLCPLPTLTTSNRHFPSLPACPQALAKKGFKPRPQPAQQGHGAGEEAEEWDDLDGFADLL